MQASPPTRNKQQTRREGGQFPLLRLRGEKPSVLYERPALLQVRPKMGAAPAAPNSRSWFKTLGIVLLFVALFAVPSYYLTSRYVVAAVVIQGRSMSPTLEDGERCYLNRWRYLFFAPRQGDLVVIKDPGHSDFAVKRVVARPGDCLNLREGKIFLNGKRLEEPYLPEGACTEVPDHQEKWILLGKNQYYVLGDNRANSEDSRFYGIVHRKQILGLLIK